MRVLHEPPGLRLWGLVLSVASCSPEPQFPASGMRFDETGATPAYTVRGRWNKGDALTWTLDTDGAPAGSDPRAAVLRALAAWQVAGALSFEPVPSPAAADVHFSFQSGAHAGCRPFGIDTSVAHTGPVAPGTFVHFDADRDWSSPGSLELAALHEIGHLLGLDHTQDPGSLMYVDPDPEASIGEAQRAGLASLYGGQLAADGSDLWVRTPDGDERVLLWRACPPNTEFAVFDADGDGRDEVLVWRTDEAGQGALTLYFFAEPLRLTRTVGPLWGTVIPGAPTSFAHLDSGERVLRCAIDGRPPMTRAFDDGGRLRGTVSADASGGRLAGSRGDLDGDGRLEQLFRRPVPR